MRKMLLAATSLPEADPLEFVDVAARAGYNGVGLRLYHRSEGAVLVARDAQRLSALNSALVSAGLEVLDVFSCYLRPESDFDGFRRALAAGANLGARYALTICADTDWARTVDNLGRLCELGAEFGIQPAIEAPLYERITPTLERAMELIDATGGTAVVALDTYQIFRTRDTLAAIERHPKRFPYAQLSDGFESPVGLRPPGQGSAPLGSMLSALPADLPLSVECVPPDQSPVAALEWAELLLASARAVVGDTSAS
jgi:sugar phosphate isomerase/epimerase